MNRIIFIDDYSPAYSCKEQEIVSLNPTVSYLLSKNNIKYHILEDYYEEKELRSLEKGYFFEQLKWFDCFDDFLKANFSYCKKNNIPLAKASYHRLKQFVDTVVIYSYILNHFFEKKSDLIENITYIHSPYIEDNKHSIYNVRTKNRKLFCDLLQLFCKKMNIQFTEHIINGRKQPPKKNIFNIIGKERFIKPQIKKIYNLIRYKKFKKIFSSNTYLKDLNIFLMQAGSLDIDYPIKEFIKCGTNIYLNEKGGILREDTFLRKPVNIPQADDNFLKDLERERRACANNLKNETEIILWINDKCSLDVSSIVLPFLKYFISKDCFCVLQDTERMFNFYKQSKIDFVFARVNTERYSLGPLIAAKYMNGSKSICTQHSSFALENEVFGVFEMETYNYTLARDSISQDYYEYSAENSYKTDCKVIQSPYYLKSIREKYAKKKGYKVIYVEKKYTDDVMKCFNNMNYPLTWYFEFQKKLVDFFAEESNLSFIYKHGQDQKWAEGSILQYIKDKGYTNIVVYREHLLKIMNEADKVIVDYPAGAFFEAAVSGKPTLCICADYIRILKQAGDVFGKSLKQFSSIEEAISAIREFLYADPKEYIVEIPFSRSDFIDVFKRINTGEE